MSLLVKLLNEELAAVKAERDALAGTLREAQSALLLCEDALLDDALDWHEAHVGRNEMDAEDCAVCVVTNALDKADRALAVPSVDATAPCEFGCGWDDDPQYARPGFTVVAGCPVHSDREGVAELPPASALAGATPHDTAASEKAAKDAAYAALIEDGPDDIRNMRPSVDATAEAKP